MDCPFCARDLWLMSKGPDPRDKLISDTRQSYADWLNQYAWSFFVTLTFKERNLRYAVHNSKLATGTHPEEANKRFNQMMHKLNMQWFGRWYRRKENVGIKWVLAQEFHKSGRVHFHALIGDDLDFTTREDNFEQKGLDATLSKQRFINQAKALWDELGFSKWDLITNKQMAVTSYVAKYVTKDGLLTFSPVLKYQDFSGQEEAGIR